ncbi:MAG TPA: EamA family transporter [Spirochaetaceae bacterium]|nr:EamA family transporter [Spirochaetaceae bacterium]
MRHEALLFIAAAIWGTGFVAQRLGMLSLPPFAFSGARFAIGALSLVPLIVFRKTSWQTLRAALGPGLLAGAVLSVAANLQQTGILYTSAGKAGFITGIYVVLVPIAATMLGRHSSSRIWLGALLAFAGLFFLSIKDGFSMERGDLIVLISAFFWTAHLLILDRWAPRVDPIALAATQFAVCSILSWAVAFPAESFKAGDFVRGMGPLLYGGLASIGIAYTLQAVAQTKAHPARASIILSLEAVFAALAGWLFLNELLSLRELLGCAFMLGGIVLAQLPDRAN